MRYMLFIAALCVATSQFSYGQHRIEVSLQGYPQDTLVLGYHLGGERFFLDTAYRSAKNLFVFEGKNPLLHGLYTVYLLPDGRYFEFVVEDAQNMAFSTHADSLLAQLQVRGSLQNEYYTACQRMQAAAQDVVAQQAELATMLRRAGAKAEAAQADMNAYYYLDSVGQVQAALVDDLPGTLVQAVVHAAREVAPPRFGGDRSKQFWYLKAHYFDDVDLSDARLIRTPYPFEKLYGYLQKFTAFHPDSLNVAADYLLQLAHKNPVTFEYYFGYLMNYFGQTEDMGMDECYVHLVENYVMKGLAPTTISAKDSAAYVRAAEAIKPTLIGSIAPDIALERRDSSVVTLHRIEAPLLVLIFWDPDCSHCQHHLPDLIAMHERVKNRGVTFVGVCTRLGPTFRRCYEYADFLNTPWETLSDHDLKSGFLKKYNLSKYPKFFILNAEKRIVAKNIPAENLERIIVQLTKK